MWSKYFSQIWTCCPLVIRGKSTFALYCGESFKNVTTLNPSCFLWPRGVGFSKVLKGLTGDSTREEMLAFILQYGTHYVSEALYGSELACNIYFPSKKAQQQLWLQYQKGEQGEGGRHTHRQ